MLLFWLKYSSAPVGHPLPTLDLIVLYIDTFLE